MASDTKRILGPGAKGDPENPSSVEKPKASTPPPPPPSGDDAPPPSDDDAPTGETATKTGSFDFGRKEGDK